MELVNIRHTRLKWTLLAIARRRFYTKFSSRTTLKTLSKLSRARERKISVRTSLSDSNSSRPRASVFLSRSPTKVCITVCHWHTAVCHWKLLLSILEIRYSKTVLISDRRVFVTTCLLTNCRIDVHCTLTGYLKCYLLRHYGVWLQYLC